MLIEMLPFDKLFDFLCSLFYEILHKELKKLLSLYIVNFEPLTQYLLQFDNFCSTIIWQVRGVPGQSTYLLYTYLLQSSSTSDMGSSDMYEFFYTPAISREIAIAFTLTAGLSIRGFFLGKSRLAIHLIVSKGTTILHIFCRFSI